MHVLIGLFSRVFQIHVRLRLISVPFCKQKKKKELYQFGNSQPRGDTHNWIWSCPVRKCIYTVRNKSDCMKIEKPKNAHLHTYVSKNVWVR